MLHSKFRVVFFGLLLTSRSFAQSSAGASTSESTQAPVLERVRVSEILISTPQPYDRAQIIEAHQRAEEVLAAIRRGDSFSDSARVNSQGPTAAQGGDIGYFTHGKLAPSLDELVFRMKVGDVSDVVRAKQGFVILKVTDRQEGDFGLGTDAHGRQMGALEVLSDTQGVDFGPYLARILQDVKENWYRLIPESAVMKKGKLAIELAIAKDGKVAGMKLIDSSGDVSLDRAAWRGITASNPFPPLTEQFRWPVSRVAFSVCVQPRSFDDYSAQLKPSNVNGDFTHAQRKRLTTSLCTITV